jgi:hypothetical protein
MKASTWVKGKLLNFEKEEKDEKPFTFSCNVGKVLGTQPATKELLLCLRCLLLQKKSLLKSSESVSDHRQCMSCKNSLHVGFFINFAKYSAKNIRDKIFSYSILFFLEGGEIFPSITPESSVFQKECFRSIVVWMTKTQRNNLSQNLPQFIF